MSQPQTADGRKVVFDRKSNAMRALPANPDDSPLPKLHKPDALKSGRYIESLKSELPDDRLIADADRHYQQAVEAFEQLESMRETADPRITRAAHLERLAMTAEAAEKQAINRVVRSAVDLDVHAAHAYDQAAKSIGVDSDSPAGNELRGILRGMDEKSRAEAIHAAIENRDQPILQAVYNAAHPLAIGIKEGSELAAIRRMILSQAEPELYARHATYRKASERLSALQQSWAESMPALTAAELRESYRNLSSKAAKAAELSQL